MAKIIYIYLMIIVKLCTKYTHMKIVLIIYNDLA